MKNRAATGFTLIELMVTIGLVAVVAAIAVPNMRDFVLNNRLNSVATELVRTLQTARSEASKRQIHIVVCMSANPTATTPTCSTSGVNSWIVFQDTNNDWDHGSTEELIEIHTFESAKVTFVSNQSMRASFSPTGFTNLTDSTAALLPVTAMAICDERGNKGAARGLLIATATGRPRVTRAVSEIQALPITGINTACPP